MASRSQSKGQALVEVLFMIILAISYCLLAKNMAEKWSDKTKKFRYEKRFHRALGMEFYKGK